MEFRGLVNSKTQVRSRRAKMNNMRGERLSKPLNLNILVSASMCHLNAPKSPEVPVAKVRSIMMWIMLSC